MDHRHLWIRAPRQQAILRIRHEVIKAVRDYFNSGHFMLADTPIFTPAACEGTTTLFAVQYFEDNTAYLTQSGQLYNEANAMALGRVYCFGPTFRAEKSKTRRHLTEFWMVEPEVAYANLEDMMDLAEGLVVSIVERVLENRQGELKTLERDTAKLEAIKAPFPRILRRCGRQAEGEGHARSNGAAISARRTRRICRGARSAGVRPPLPVRDQGILLEAAHGPSRGVARHRPARPEGYGEIIGGGQRLEDLDLLLQRSRNTTCPGDFEWYLDLRRYGSVPHAGFGMGIERVVAWMCGIEHVRETIPFPRMLYRMYP